MRPVLLSVFLLAAVAALAARTAEGEEGREAGASAPRTDLRTVAGRIAAVDEAGRNITVETTDGQVVLEFDRNTNVYLPDRLGNVRDLTAGARVRASFGAERRAYWIEVQPRGD